MEITKGIIAAIEKGVAAIYSRADEIEREPDYIKDNSVGRILRLAVEEDRQAADMLAGWLKRVIKEKDNG